LASLDDKTAPAATGTSPSLSRWRVQPGEVDFLKRRTRRKFPAVQIAVGYGADPVTTNTGNIPPPSLSSSPPIWSVRPHTRTQDNAVARGNALIRFGFSDLNQVDLSFPPDRRESAWPCFHFRLPCAPFVPPLYPILSPDPSTLLRACRWDALRARASLFFDAAVSIYTNATRFSAIDTKRAQRNRSTKCSYRDRRAL